MKTATILAGTALALGLSYGLGLAQHAGMGGKLIYVPVKQAQFEGDQAVLWGDPEKGPYGAYTRFAPGADWGRHSHTNDVWLVVLEGAYLYRDDTGEKRVGAGDFIRVPGGHVHWSGADAKEGALFYEEAAGRFDSIPAQLR